MMLTWMTRALLRLCWKLRAAMCMRRAACSFVAAAPRLACRLLYQHWMNTAILLHVIQFSINSRAKIILTDLRTQNLWESMKMGCRLVLSVPMQWTPTEPEKTRNRLVGVDTGLQGAAKGSTHLSLRKRSLSTAVRPQGLMTASAASSAALRAATRLRNSQRARYPRASACDIDQELKLQACIFVPPKPYKRAWIKCTASGLDDSERSVLRRLAGRHAPAELAARQILSRQRLQY